LSTTGVAVGAAVARLSHTNDAAEAYLEDDADHRGGEKRDEDAVSHERDR
jgi:hypothetical protein